MVVFPDDGSEINLVCESSVPPDVVVVPSHGLPSLA
jgi:hypothetical protein